MSNKQWSFKLLLFFVSLSVFIMIFNYIIDPFQQYRISSWYEISSKKQRNITPGLAKNLHSSTILIGSSMAENFQASFINKELNTDSLKLCMSGMTAHETYQLLNIIIKHNPNIKEIILSLDFYALSGLPTNVRNLQLPLYLYDDKMVNDIFYLLNKETLKYSVKMLRKSLNKKTNFDKMWYWGDSVEFSEKATIASYQTAKFNTNFKLKDYIYNTLEKSFNFNILPILKNNPQIQFTIFYPPYSYLTYQDMQKKSWLNETFKLKRYINELNLNNLVIYDFQCISSITENLNNYKDISHYSPKINKYIISSIKNKKHLSDTNNIHQCLIKIKQSAAKIFTHKKEK